MVCRVCGIEYGGAEEVHRICTECIGNDPTLTLWVESIGPDTTAEDSIRSPLDVARGFDPEMLPRRQLGKGADGAAGGTVDFALGDRLGSGGMGDVYSASQTTIRRSVAIKMAKADRADTRATTDALMAEAVVTGNLDHPNVVPVHDLCVDEEGNVFFVMKEVHGRPWSEVMAEQSLDENLDILLRVADTIAFAHSKGILHRDLKPHNIMIGEFGEVMVMDWGASCAFRECTNAGARTAESSFCGTPAYMPPEMAKGDANRLSESSDVYLLGAILYQILTGHPPRRVKDPVLSLSQAVDNVIEPIRSSGEMERIAMKAMATCPSDRFADVKAFQQAVRNFRTHAECIRLLDRARENLEHACDKQDYEWFNRAIYGLRQASELWPDHAEIDGLLQEARLAYARCALTHTDYELAQSLLDADHPEHARLLELIRQGMQERDAHQRRNRQLRRTARLLVLLLLLIFATAFFLIRAEQQKTELQRERADSAHRRSLITLVSSQYQAKEYEAATATFWELNDNFGLDGLSQETLLDVRVAAAMNPWRGAVDSGVKDALGIIPARQDGSVWVVGSNAVKKITIDHDMGWEEESLVSIYDYTFGKRKPPGHISQALDIPFTLANVSAFYEARDGTLWAGGGSILYRRDVTGAEWTEVIDVSSLDIPRTAAGVISDDETVGQYYEWLLDEGGSQPITGIVVTDDEEGVGISLRGGAVFWIDLAHKRVDGWMHANLFVGQLNSKETRYPAQMKLSADESHFCYVEGVNGTIQVMFKMPDFQVEAIFYARDYLFLDAVFQGPDQMTALTSDGMVFSINQQTYDDYGPIDYTIADRTRWGPERYLLRSLDDKQLKLAALNEDGSRVCALSDDKILYVGPTEDNTDYEIRLPIIQRSYQDAHLTEDGYMLLLDSESRLQVYDVHTYSMARVEIPNAPPYHLGAGREADLLHYTTYADGFDNICSLDISDAADPRLLEHGNIEAGFVTLKFDPMSRYYAYSREKGDVAYSKIVYLHTLEGNRQVAVFDTAWCDRLRFSEDGKYLISGGNWSEDIDVISTLNQERCFTMASGADGGYSEVYLDQQYTPPRVIAARAAGWQLSSHDLGPPGGGMTTNWINKSSGVPMSIIPFSDPDSGKHLYWYRTWFGALEAHDAETGQLMKKSNTYWDHKSPGQAISKSFYANVVLPMVNGQVQICRKSDFYPVFDPRTIDFKVDKAVLNTDASKLFLLSDGTLYSMQLPEM